MGSMARLSIALAVVVTAQASQAQDAAPAKCPLLNESLLKRVAAFGELKAELPVPAD